MRGRYTMNIPDIQSREHSVEPFGIFVSGVQGRRDEGCDRDQENLSIVVT